MNRVFRKHVVQYLPKSLNKFGVIVPSSPRGGVNVNPTHVPLGNVFPGDVVIAPEGADISIPTNIHHIYKQSDHRVDSVRSSCPNSHELCQLETVCPRCPWRPMSALDQERFKMLSVLEFFKHKLNVELNPRCIVPATPLRSSSQPLRYFTVRFGTDIRGYPVVGIPVRIQGLNEGTLLDITSGCVWMSRPMRAVITALKEWWAVDVRSNNHPKAVERFPGWDGDSRYPRLQSATVFECGDDIAVRLMMYGNSEYDYPLRQVQSDQLAPLEMKLAQRVVDAAAYPMVKGVVAIGVLIQTPATRSGEKNTNYSVSRQSYRHILGPYELFAEYEFNTGVAPSIRVLVPFYLNLESWKAKSPDVYMFPFEPRYQAHTVAQSVVTMLSSEFAMNPSQPPKRIAVWGEITLSSVSLAVLKAFPTMIETLVSVNLLHQAPPLFIPRALVNVACEKNGIPENQVRTLLAAFNGERPDIAIVINPHEVDVQLNLL
eukprot:PhF_6_TR14980/c0_g1_i2/m.23542